MPSPSLIPIKSAKPVARLTKASSNHPTGVSTNAIASTMPNIIWTSGLIIFSSGATATAMASIIKLICFCIDVAASACRAKSAWEAPTSSMLSAASANAAVSALNNFAASFISLIPAAEAIACFSKRSISSNDLPVALTACCKSAILSSSVAFNISIVLMFDPNIAFNLDVAFAAPSIVSN